MRAHDVRVGQTVRFRAGRKRWEVVEHRPGAVELYRTDTNEHVTVHPRRLVLLAQPDTGDLYDGP